MPAPTSVAQKKLRGSYNSTRDANKIEAKPGTPVSPSGLNKDEQLMFNQAAQLLDSMQALALIDVFALEGFAKCAVEKRLADAQLAREGYILHVERNGETQTSVNPLVKITSDLDQRYLRYLKSLGLTPIDRNRLQRVKTNTDAKTEEAFGDF
jgi:P27 family predicted phage terminase small subunit